MPDFTLTLEDFGFAAPPAVLAIPSIAVPTLPAAATAWNVWASDEFGAEIQEYPTAKVTRIVWTLDAPTSCDFDIPIDAPGLQHLKLPNPTYARCAEVKLYRNGHLIFRGPVVTRRCSSQERVWHYTAYDPLWYFLHRNMGQADRHNYLGDSSFDASLSGWTPVGSTSPSAIDTSRYLIGGGSLNLGAADSGENYWHKSFSISSGSIGLALFLTAWVYVDSFTAPAFSSRGAFIQRVGATGPGAYGYRPLDENTPLGTWTRMSTHVNMPPNVTETIDVRLYSPHGEVHWDGVTVTIMESLSLIDENSAGGTGWDQTLIAQMTAKYLSGNFPIGGTYTKSNVRISVAGAASGIKKERTYQFVDHRPGYEGGVGNGALDEWPKAEEGFDYRIDNDSTTVRTFRTYWPAVGQVWDDAKTTGSAPDVHSTFHLARIIVADEVTGTTWGIYGYDYGETVEGSATDICELGTGSEGTGREEGSFSDDTALGGLTLELVEAAPADAPLDMLDSLAQQRGAQLAKPIGTPTLTMAEPKDDTTKEVLVTLIGELLPGDLIPVIVDDADVQLDDIYRVTQVTLNDDETLTVGIAP